MPRGLATKTFDLITAAAQILADQHPMGVRGVAYQLFNRKLIPDMSRASTKRVSEMLTIARKRELIPWDWIVDDNREFETVHQWDTMADFMEAVRRSYRHNRWKVQPLRIAVVSEKAWGGVLRPVTEAYGIPFVVYSGWTSTTAAKKLADESRRDRRPFVILYVGDFDPAGMRMSEDDLPNRLTEYGGRAIVHRVALVGRHISEYGLGALTFSVHEKTKDPSYQWFIRHYGETCCELDALPANDLRDLVEDAIADHFDPDAWETEGEAEERYLIAIDQFVDAAQVQDLGL